MQNIIYTVLFVVILLTSCQKSDENDNLVISAGFACGWGTGADSIDISKSEIQYVYYVPAESMLPKIKGRRSITESEWYDIKSAIKIDEFLKLDYNSCNICVDGCDEWIAIQNDQISHSIRYSKGLKIENLEKLQSVIASIRSEFN